MARVTLDNVSKIFGRTKAVDNISMQVEDGEFIALLGASGCGKTTLLRLLAGFESVDQGSIAIDGEVVSGEGRHMPPERRRVGMVFQAYALWPHMTVRQNVEFSLKIRHETKSKRRSTVDDALAAVGMLELAERKPSDLSGGQRQRVALARCLAMNPRLVLLDEPLANLDVNLRESMQEEFRRFHSQTGSTMVYVTHDQAEAMTLADRIMVMDKGHILQASPPRTLYQEPVCPIVAQFVGKGMLVPVRIDAPVNGECSRVELFGHSATMRGRAEQGARTTACLRPENLRLSDNGDGFTAKVTNYVYHGGGGVVHLHPEDAPDLILRVQHQGVPPRVNEPVRVVVRDGWIMPGEA